MSEEVKIKQFSSLTRLIILYYMVLYRGTTFILYKKGHIGIVEKVQEISSDTGMHNRAITVLHEL